MTKYQKPFLKWAGNKYRYLDKIFAQFPTKANCLIEPFMGSGAIFINTNYSSYILADQNADLINLYNYLKNDGEDFIHACSEYFLDTYNNKESFYDLRETFNNSNFTKLRAILFVYLNRHGYNGLCRYNKSNDFNVPFGTYKQPYFPYQEMLKFYNKSQNIKFLCNNFSQTFALAQPGDLIYCDPPYVPLSNSAYFSAYTNNIFTDADQINLANLAIEAAQRNIYVIISNHDTEVTRQYYQSSNISSFSAQRLISCKAQKRQYVQELIAVFKKK